MSSAARNLDNEVASMEDFLVNTLATIDAVRCDFQMRLAALRGSEQTNPAELEAEWAAMDAAPTVTGEALVASLRARLADQGSR